jgi:hypothetical protein
MARCSDLAAAARCSDLTAIEARAWRDRVCAAKTRSLAAWRDMRAWAALARIRSLILAVCAEASRAAKARWVVRSAMAERARLAFTSARADAVGRAARGWTALARMVVAARLDVAPARAC